MKLSVKFIIICMFLVSSSSAGTIDPGEILPVSGYLDSSMLVILDKEENRKPSTNGPARTAATSRTTDTCQADDGGEGYGADPMWAGFEGSSASFLPITVGGRDGIAPVSMTHTDSMIDSIVSVAVDPGNSTNGAEKYMVHMPKATLNESISQVVPRPGVYSTIPGGECIRAGNVGSPPVAGFTATPRAGLAPIVVSFTDTSGGDVSAWNWEYRSGSGSWTRFSSLQNATAEFTAGAVYDIRLTVFGPGGSSDLTKTDYIAISPGRSLLTMVKNGIVSGDVYIGAYQPVPWGIQPSTPGEKRFNQSFKIPEFTSIHWARLYAAVCAADSGDCAGLVTVSFDGNGDGVFDETLGREELHIPATTGPEVYPVNDHVTRQSSDYLLWYDVTGLIGNCSVNAGVVTGNVNNSAFDGRLKALALVVAYNDSDMDEIHYWVNQGHDYQYPGELSGHTTRFPTALLSGNCTSANLAVVHLSNKDASYSLNGQKYLGSNPLAPVNYFGRNTWNVTTSWMPGRNSTMVYTHAKSASYKTPLAVLTALYAPVLPAPVANFTSDVVSGTAPLTVRFIDTSINSPSWWSWDFGDGNASTTRDPVYTYASAGTYSVNLTVRGPGGTDTLFRKEYITVSGGISITSVKPTYSPRGRPVSLTIHGTNMTAGSQVFLSRGPEVIQATNVVNHSRSKITCRVVIPTGASVGAFDVVLINGFGQAGKQPGGFRVLSGPSPVISTLSRNVMYPNTTRNFILHGRDFQDGANVTFSHAKFGSLPAMAVVTSPMQIYITLSLPPGEVTGTWDCSVTNPDMGTFTRKNALIVKPWGTPQVTRVFPVFAYKNATTSLVLKGGNFQPGATALSFSVTGQPDIPLTNLTVISPTKITGTVSVPGDALQGRWETVVTTVDGGSGTRSKSLVIRPWPRPLVTSVMPARAAINKSVPFTIAGNYLQDGALVFFNRTGTPDILVPDSYRVVDRREIIGNLTIPPGTAAGRWNVVVTTPDGGTAISFRRLFIAP